MNQKGFALPFVILIGVVLIVLLGLVVERVVFGDRHITPPKSGLTASGQKCLSNNNPVFNGEFTDRSKILYIKPLGDTQAGSSARKSTILVKEGSEVPIYNPIEATLEQVLEKDGKGTLSFQVSCEVGFVFGGLDKVSDKIQAKTTIKKGELLGYVNGLKQGSSFDFMVSNTSKPITFINPKRWSKDLYAQCPYEYFSARNDNNLKRDYIAYTLVNNDNIIQKNWNDKQGISQIPCGDLSHDIAGTASGGWFKGESTDVNGDYLSVNKYLSTTQISIRQNGHITYSLTDYTRDVLPSEVKEGQSTCYFDQKQNKWVFVQLTSGQKLAMAKGEGQCPSSFPQEISETWER